MQFDLRNFFQMGWLKLNHQVDMLCFLKQAIMALRVGPVKVGLDAYFP